MADRKLLQAWVLEAVRTCGGSASLLDVAKHIWAKHETELRASGPLFYTWQYDMRWAADALRRAGLFKPSALSAPGMWEIDDAHKAT